MQRRWLGHESLKGQVALLFDGAFVAIGPLAVSLAEHGADVAIAYHGVNAGHVRRTKERIEAEDRRCVTILSRPNDAQFPREVVSETIARLGRLDIFIDYSSGSERQAQPLDSSRSRPMINVGILTAAITQILNPERTG